MKMLPASPPRCRGPCSAGSTKNARNTKSVIARKTATDESSLATTKRVIARAYPSPEVLPPPEYDRLAVSDQHDALALFAAADHRETVRILDRGQKLVVLAEREVVRLGAFGERHAIEVDDHAAGGPGREPSGVGGDPVGEGEHRMGVRRQPASLLAPDRRSDVAAAAKGRAGGAERAGDDERVAGPGARA